MDTYTNPQQQLSSGANCNFIREVLSLTSAKNALVLNSTHANAFTLRELEVEFVRCQFEYIDVENVFSNAEVLSNKKVDVVFWLYSAHEHPMEFCQDIIRVVTRVSEVIAFAAESLSYYSSGINFLWPDQWAQQFSQYSYVLVDLFRDIMIRDGMIDERIAQNLVLFINSEKVAGNSHFRSYISRSAKRMVHPDRLVRHKITGAYLPDGTENDWTLSEFILSKWKSNLPLSKRISLVITFHREQYLAFRTLNSASVAADLARSYGLDVELICMLDRTDDVTLNVVSDHPLVRDFGRVICTDLGDPGCARNTAVDVATGDFIAIMDGDDLCTRNWLVEAFKRVCECPLPVIVHPEYILAFGSAWYYHETPDTLRMPLNTFNPSIENLWFSVCFAPKLVFELIPYSRSEVSVTGFGYEDWHWACESFAAGIPHVTAKETALYYRRKVQSRVVQDGAKNAVIWPTAFLRNRVICD